MGGHGTWILNRARETGDGYLLELLIDAATSWEYAISRSGITNGIASNAVIERVTPWWQTAVTAATVCSGILTAACFVLLAATRMKEKDE